MKKAAGKLSVLSILLVIVTSVAGYCADATYDNLTVNINEGIGGTDNNHKLSVFDPFGSTIAGGYSPVYVRINGNATPPLSGGTSFGFMGVYSAIRGEVFYANPYSVAVSAHSQLDNNYTAALVAANGDGSYSARLSYKDGTGIVWPGYYVTSGANALQYGIGIRNPNSTDAGGSATGILFSVEGSGDFGKGAIVYERKSSYARGSIHFLQEKNGNTTNPGLGNKVMTITNGGVVGIGIEPSATTSNKLEVLGNTAVKGTVFCNALKVTKTITPWPDYVFDKNYKTHSLSETESFIKKNRHLPGMPSQKEIAKNGVDIGEMQAKLLKTMEEMTLQMIEQNKKIEQLTKVNDELRRKFEEQK